MEWAKSACVRWRMETIHPGGGATHARLRRQALEGTPSLGGACGGARNHRVSWFPRSLDEVLSHLPMQGRSQLRR
jgi:hypothetical protein